ncbi:MAG TPA: DUF4038 domain-containing protein [Kofleriaceae bacterium]|nr:DUF4038 domain-containing protein [Kofleriaceae bacterium]
MASARTHWRLSAARAAHLALAVALGAIVVAALGLGACSGSPGATGDDGGGGGGDGGGGGGDGGTIPDGGLTLPDGGGPPPASLFPLAVSADRASLVAHDGTPFLLHGEAAWSLIAQLSTSGAMQYLADRRTRGVNAVIANLIEHQYADRAPANAAGDAPFTAAGDFTKPNEKYFAHADQVIDIAAAQGIAVLLVPAYLGFDGGGEGWYSDMSALTAQQCRTYGDFVGRRYASKSNIVWVWGGDYTPPTGDAGETCLKAIRDGILAAAPAGTLSTGHWSPESTSRDEAAFVDTIDLVGVYTYLDILAPCRAARDPGGATPRKPTFLVETCYENETIRSCADTTAEVRRRQWWGLLGCGAGEISGNTPIWRFSSGWPQALASPVSSSQVRLTTIAHSIRWQALALDDDLVTSDRGNGYTEIAAARTTDAGSAQALIYMPPGAAASVTVDLSRLGASVTATWEDPSAVRSMPAGTALSGSHTFARPGKNAGGDTDWVLILTAP